MSAEPVFFAEIAAALKEWREAIKIWDDTPGEDYAPTNAEMKRCNDAAKALRAIADRMP